MTLTPLFTKDDELIRKTMDQLVFLFSGYETGTISKEALSVGVETIWNILSGVVGDKRFNEIISEANQELRKL